MIKFLTTTIIGGLILVQSAWGQWRNLTNVDDWDKRKTEGSGVTAYTDKGLWRFFLVKTSNGSYMSYLSHKLITPDSWCLYRNVEIKGKIDGEHFEIGYDRSINDLLFLTNPRDLYDKASRGKTLQIRVSDSCYNSYDMTFDVTGKPGVKFD